MLILGIIVFIWIVVSFLRLARMGERISVLEEKFKAPRLSYNDEIEHLREWVLEAFKRDTETYREFLSLCKFLGIKRTGEGKFEKIATCKACHQEVKAAK